MRRLRCPPPLAGEGKGEPTVRTRGKRPLPDRPTQVGDGSRCTLLQKLKRFFQRQSLNRRRGSRDVCGHQPCLHRLPKREKSLTVWFGFALREKSPDTCQTVGVCGPEKDAGTYRTKPQV